MSHSRCSSQRIPLTESWVNGTPVESDQLVLVGELDDLSRVERLRLAEGHRSPVGAARPKGQTGEEEQGRPAPGPGGKANHPPGGRNRAGFVISTAAG